MPLKALTGAGESLLPRREKVRMRVFPTIVGPQHSSGLQATQTYPTLTPATSPVVGRGGRGRGYSVTHTRDQFEYSKAAKFGWKSCTRSDQVQRET